MMRVIPVLFYVLIGIASAAVVLPAGVLFAAPPEEKLPELSKPKLHREETELEKAVNRAAAMLLQGKLPASEDGVRFALWLYGEKGDVAYLDVATKMARKLGDFAGSTALFSVAQAGGSTLDEANAVMIMNEPRGGYKSVRRRLAKIAATRGATEIGRQIDLDFFRDPHPAGEPDAGHFQDTFRQDEYLTLADGEEWLRLHIDLIQLLAFANIERALGVVAHNVVDRFQDPTTGRFVDKRDPSVWLHPENARTALAVWETGLLIGDAALRERGQKALESDLEAALEDPNAVAIAGLAAGRMSRHPMQMAVIGDPADPAISALRQAAYFLFEPNKVILNLDPKTDSARMAELMYPAEAAPAMFVCVETLCSPPIKDPAELEKQVAEIKKLAAEVQQ